MTIYKQHINELMSALSQIDALYADWAKKNNQNYYMSHIFYVIYMSSPLKQKEIVIRAGMPKQTVNSVILQLLKKEYISLNTDITDKRSKIITMTEKGRSLAQSVFEPLLTCEMAALEKIGIKRVENMLGTLKEYSQYLKQKMQEELKDNLEKGNE